MVSVPSNHAQHPEKVPYEDYTFNAEQAYLSGVIVGLCGAFFLIGLVSMALHPAFVVMVLVSGGLGLASWQGYRRFERTWP